MSAGEEFITLPVAQWLEKRHWTIESVALPGGGGLEFAPQGGNPRQGRRGLVPDILVSHPRYGWLAVECKPVVNLEDAEKLLRLRSESYSASVRFLLRIDPIDLHIAAAFGVPTTDAQRAVASAVRELVPIGLVVASEVVSPLWDDVGVVAGDIVH